uniref:Phosphoserine phosphatase n=2 Tax=Aegilops tauschii subsp. strangulata TaxID=200361 RepID=A0A453AYM1_AEGTS
ATLPVTSQTTVRQGDLTSRELSYCTHTWARHPTGRRTFFRFASAGMHGMASPISVRTSPRHPLSVPRSSLVRSTHASHLVIRVADPLFPCAKLSKARAVVAAVMEVSKAPSSSGLANRQPSKEVLETWRSVNAVCFDVDSTVCLDEGIDELADFCGAGQAVAEWTTKAMTGTVPFEEALAARISLIKPSLSQVEDCLEKRPPR